jgi:hypothetical protein
MKKFIAIIIILCLSFTVAAQDNYKLGDFSETQVKAKELNLGGSWTVKKNSANKGLDFYYGKTRLAYLSTVGTFYSPYSISGTGIFTTGVAIGSSSLISETRTYLTNIRYSLNVDDTLTCENLYVTATMRGSSLIRGNAAFTGNLTRVAVYIPGLTNTSYVLVQPIAAAASTRPDATDVLSTFIVNDSLIVMRKTGTTAALSFDWFRIK